MREKTQVEIITENLVGFGVVTVGLGLFSAGGFFGDTGHWIVGTIFGLPFAFMLWVMFVGFQQLWAAKRSEMNDD